MTSATPAPAAPKGEIAPLTPEQAISTFVLGAVLAKTVWAVSGPRGLAHVASPTGSGRQALLVWSGHHEAGKWADVLCDEPELATIDIAAFMAETLPRASLANTVIAPDWSSEPVEPEIEPTEILSRLQQALVRDFVLTATKTRSIFVLRDAERVMPVTLVDGCGEVVPVFSDRSMAEAAALQCPGSALAVRMPLPEFTGRFLLTAQGVRARIAPAYVHCAGAISFSTWEFKALLAGGPAATRAA